MKRFLRLVSLLLCVAGLLPGCSHAPANRELEMLRTTAPRPGMSRVVIYFPPHFLLSTDSLKVVLDGKDACYLKDGAYSVGEVIPATHELIFSYCGTRNLTRVTLTALAGQTYYLRVMPYDSSITGMLSDYPSEKVDKEESWLTAANENAASNTGGNAPGMKGSGRGENKGKHISASKTHSGPFEVKLIDAATALEALASMKYVSSAR